MGSLNGLTRIEGGGACFPKISFHNMMSSVKTSFVWSMQMRIIPAPKKHLYTLLWLIGILLLTFGCTPTQTNLAPGTYTNNFSIEELPEKFGPPWNPEGYPGSLIAGEWEMTLSEEDEIIWRQNNTNWSSGNYNVYLSTLEFGFDSICNSIGVSSASYSWSLDGDKVTFERIEDDCEGRAIVLTLKPWTLQ